MGNRKSLDGLLRGIARDAAGFRAVVKVALKHGWRVEATRNNHVRFLSPDGKHMFIASTTAGSSGAMSKLKAQLRKAGLPLT
jgi:predicted RNA binding protein YcfA (HicA-like mRNA interferase family)